MARPPHQPPVLPALVLAATLLAVGAPVRAQSQSAATMTYGPGVWHFDTPQVFTPDSVLALQITGIGGGPCDPCHPLLVFEQGVRFAGTLRVTMTPDWFFYASQGYTLFSYWNVLPEGQFSVVELPALPDGLAWQSDLYIGGTIRALAPLAVPEPGTWALWLAGLAAGAGVARRVRTG